MLFTVLPFKRSSSIFAMLISLRSLIVDFYLAISIGFKKSVASKDGTVDAFVNRLLEIFRESLRLNLVAQIER